MDIHALLALVENSDSQELYLYEADVYLFLQQKTLKSRPLFVTAFLVVSDWFGTSQRSGVWTFYESANTDEIYEAIHFLRENGDDEIAQNLEKGIHDYQHPIYAGSFDYPQEWMEEADEIDAWITHNEELLWKWEYELLVVHKQVIAAL